MIAPGGRSRDIIQELVEAPSAGGGPAPAWLVESMCQRLACDTFAVYRPTRDAEGVWHLGALVGTDPELLARYDVAMAHTQRTFLYDPLRPALDQRNTVQMLREIHRHGSDETCIIEDVWPDVGLGGSDQLRALACDGPVLLAWVGGLRHRPFTEEERRIFTDLLPFVRRALGLHRRLADAGLASADIARVLEAVAAPAFIARPDGSVDHANAAGCVLVERSAADALARVRDAVAGHDSASLVGRLDAAGPSARFVVILRDDEAVLEARLAEAKRQWGVTAREAAVLRLVVGGDANKEIALKLACHEGTVERHLTSLLRKARCDSRSRLIAHFWTQL